MDEDLGTSMPPVRLKRPGFPHCGTYRSVHVRVAREFPLNGSAFCHLGNIPRRNSNTAFGVRCNSNDEGNFDYICGVEVSDFEALVGLGSHTDRGAEVCSFFAPRTHLVHPKRLEHNLEQVATGIGT